MTFQNTAISEVEVFIDVRSAGEIHLYALPLNIADLAFTKEPSGMNFVLSKFDTGILNESYWEKGTSDDVNDKFITKEGHIFRHDYCPTGRLFKDELGLTGEVIGGNLVKTAWKSFQKICELSRNSTCPIEFSALQTDAISYHDLQNSFTLFSFTTPLQKFLYSSADNRIAKIVFREKGSALKLLEAILRDLLIKLTGAHVSHINTKTLEMILDTTDKLGFTIHPERDFINKDRSFELVLNLGKTGWGVHHELFHGDEKLFLYYDRTSGIWASLT